MTVDEPTMASGPTQNYEDAELGRWQPHPVLAVLVRVAVVVLPMILAIAFGLAAQRWASAQRLGVNAWVWLAVEIALSTVLLVYAGRLTRRLLPLAALLRLTLYFPDRAPSRLAVATRTHSPAALRPGHAPANPALTDEKDHAEHVLDLLGAITAHDAVTRAHSERVQGYAALIGAELGLGAQEAARLGWAALLHDVGKLAVPASILDKAGRPTEEEWAVLATHPSHGATIAAPLASWLGPWLDAIGQHHERWDGLGYPLGLAGTAISPAARIVAVADAYDAITSARSYKKPLSAAAAREEIARCAGAQFDPEVVRALLAVGLGRLQRVAGPASALAGLPGIRSLPGADAASVVATVGTTVPAVTSGALAGLIGIALAAGGALTGTAAHAEPSDPAAGGVRAAVADAFDDEASPAPTTTGTATPSPADLPAQPSPGASDIATTSTTAPGGTPAPTSGPTAVATSGPAGPALPPPEPTSSATPAPADACSRLRSGEAGLAGSDMSGCDLSGLTLTGSLAGAKLSGADLRGARLTGLDLTGAQLTGARLTGATITSTSFDDATLTGASFDRATITGSTFRRATMTPGALDKATVTDCVFE